MFDFRYSDKVTKVMLCVCTVVALATAVGCDSSAVTANGCSPAIPCTDPERPFCDIDGEYPESNGVPNVCIAQPAISDAGVDTVSTEDAAQDDTSDAGVVTDEDDLASVANIRFTVTEAQHDSVAVSNTSPAIVHTIKNHGDGQTDNLTIKIVGAGKDQFGIYEDHCSGMILDPGASCTVTTVFTPTKIEKANATLQITVAKELGASIQLRGVGLQPGEVTLSTRIHDFGGAKAGVSSSLERVITVNNGGGAVVSGIAVVLNDTTNFSLRNNGCASELPAGQSCEIVVGFDPMRVAAFETTLNLTADGGIAHEVTLQGVGMAQLTVTRSGDGAGTIFSDMEGINCGTQCTALFAPGTEVTLKTNVDNSSDLESWSGDCSGSSATCTLTLDKDRIVQAKLVKMYTLTVKVSGAGKVKVEAANTATKTCDSGTCTYKYPTGTKPKMTATADSSKSFFKKWSDAACSGSTCTLAPLGADKTYTAYFGNYYTLTVKVSCDYHNCGQKYCEEERIISLAGSTPHIELNQWEIPRIAWPSDNQDSIVVKEGQRLVFTAVDHDEPDDGYYGDHWLGCDRTSSLGACTLNVNEDKTIYHSRWCPDAAW